LGEPAPWLGGKGMDEAKLREAAFVLWVRQGGSPRAFSAAWASLRDYLKRGQRPAAENQRETRAEEPEHSPAPLP
jgi:hypothetical protein